MQEHIYCSKKETIKWEGVEAAGGSVRAKLEQSRITNMYENTKLKLTTLYEYINTKVQ